MALSMLVFVPIFLYALFLDDLLRYSLDAQEAALSTVWDFTVQDYSRSLPESPSSSLPPGGQSTVQKQARLMFCDHESGIDSFKLANYVSADGKPFQNYPDCEGTDHHQALAAHVCWINPDARQVTCEAPDGSTGSLGVPLHGEYQSAFTRGGLIQCSARAVVENYLLPQSFLREFTKVDLTKKQWGGSGKAIHTNSEEGKAHNAYFLAQQQLAILTDTWALTRPARYAPDQKKGELYERVASLYQSSRNRPFNDLDRAVPSFFQKATSDELLTPGLLGKADDPRTPNLSIAPQKDENPSQRIREAQGSASYFNTEWRDWEGNPNEATYKQRKEGYLGCRPGEGCE
jgi:hypothetical protein